MSTFDVTARIRLTDSDRLAEARQELATLEQFTQQEPNCVTFKIFEDREQVGDFILWECWRAEVDLQNHFKQQHTLDYLSLNLTEVVELTKQQALI